MEDGKCLSTEKGRSRGKIEYGKLRKRRQKNGHVIVTFHIPRHNRDESEDRSRQARRESPLTRRFKGRPCKVAS